MPLHPGSFSPDRWKAAFQNRCVIIEASFYIL